MVASWIAIALVLAPNPTPRPCPKIALRVNGRPITSHQIRLAAELTLRRAPATERAHAYRSAMEGLITTMVLAQEAERRDLEADAKSVDAAEQESRRAFDDEKAWRGFLSAQGFDAKAYRIELRVQIRARAVMVQEAEDKVPPATDAEAIAYIQASVPDITPTAPQIEAARWELTRVKRGMVTRELVEDLRAKARIERYCD